MSNTGTINAGQNGIQIINVAHTPGTTTLGDAGNPVISGGVSNSGSITSTGTGYAGIYMDGGIVDNGITNTSTGTITANNGVGILLTDTGKITYFSGTVYTSLGGPATVNGNITNDGTVTAQTGIKVTGGSNVTGDITNNGTIAASYVGVYVQNASVTGNIVNSATGQMNGAGIYVTGSSVGGISNAGTIANTVYPQPAITVTAGTVNGDISNTGTITTLSTGGIAVVNNSNVTGNITNSGTITDNPGRGIWVYAGADHSNPGGTTIGGSISNTATGQITAAKGIGIYATSATSLVHIAGAGGVSNAGTMTVTQTGISIGSATVDGAVSNTGTINAGQNGIQIINVANTPGTTTLGDAGNPVISGGVSNSGSITSTGTGYAGIYMDGGNVANGITNTATGTITANNGVGILLSNTGQITYFSGTVYTSLGGPASVTGGISNAGTITAKTGIMVTGGSTVTGGITNTGTINASVNAIDVSGEGAASTINQNGGSITGNVLLSTLADTVNIAGGTVDGNIVGAGSSNTLNFTLGSGTFTYSSSYGFSGINQVNVNSGTVILGGTNDATNVDVVGGTLAGAGSITTTMLTIQSGGTFAPGTPSTPGTSMTVTGNVTFNSSSTYVVYVNPSSATSAQVSGTAAVDGTVQAAFASGAYSAHSYSVLHAGTVNGTFASLTTTNLSSGFTASLSYTATDVMLDLTANIGGGGGATGTNQQNLAGALNNYFNNGGTLPANFVQAFGGPNSSELLSQGTGETTTGSQTTSIQMMTQFLSIMVDPTTHIGGGDGTFGGSSSSFASEGRKNLPPDVAMAYASVLKAPAKRIEEQRRWNTWATGFGGYNKTDGSTSLGANSVTSRVYGVAGGFDYRLTPNIVAGVAFAGGNTSWSLSQNLGSGNSDVFQAGVYSIGKWGPAYVSASLAFSNYWTKTDRYGPLSDHLTASFNAHSFGGRLEGGYTVATFSNLSVTPYGALQAQTFHTPAYSETDLTGGGFGLTYASRNSNATRAELGSRFESPFVVDGKPLVLRARAAWAHDWVSDPSANATFQTVPGVSFIVNGATPPKDSALTSASAEYFLTQQLSLMGRFEGEFASGSQTYTGLGTVRYVW